MAQPIQLEMPPLDPRKQLQARLENASAADAEALLDAFELLQVLHDRHVSETMGEVLGAGVKLAESAAKAAYMPRSAAALRNVIVLSKTLASIDPQLLQGIAIAVSETLGSAKSPAAEPPGMLALLNQFRNKELRRSVGLISQFLEALGNQLKLKDTTNAQR
jgi:uncharacterized protein YjgD (DUF1641 family)